MPTVAASPWEALCTPCRLAERLLGACAQALQRLQCETQVKNLGGSNWHGLRILGRSSLFIKLTACTMLSGIVAEGFYELISQYLQLKLDFDVKDMVSLLRATMPSMSCARFRGNPSIRCLCVHP